MGGGDYTGVVRGGCPAAWDVFAGIHEVPGCAASR